MVSKRILAVAGVFTLVVGGWAVWAYSGCGACGGHAAKPVETQATTVATMTPFEVIDVTGPAKGKELCYICRYGGRPQFVVFTRTTDGHFADVAKAVDTFVAAHKDQRLAGFVVLLAENNEANRATLTKLAADHKLSIPLTIAADGPAGPKSYNLGNDFQTLVLVAHKNKVHNTIPLQCIAKTCGSKDCAKTETIAEAGKELLGSI
jgi:hypothetical protein